MSERVLGEASRQEDSLVEQIKAAIDEWVEYNLLDHITTQNLAPFKEKLLALVQKDREEHNKRLNEFQFTLVHFLDRFFVSDEERKELLKKFVEVLKS